MILPGLPRRAACDVCGGTIQLHTERAVELGIKWDGTNPCPCGGRHATCTFCASQLSALNVMKDWGPDQVPYAVCPVAPETHVAAEVMGKSRPPGWGPVILDFDKTGCAFCDRSDEPLPLLTLDCRCGGEHLTCQKCRSLWGNLMAREIVETDLHSCPDDDEVRAVAAVMGRDQ